METKQERLSYILFEDQNAKRKRLPFWAFHEFYMDLHKVVVKHLFEVKIFSFRKNSESLEALSALCVWQPYRVPS